MTNTRNQILAMMLLWCTVHASCFSATTLLHGRIVKVTDGDTVTLQDDHQTIHKIRLAGIDAPELKMPYGTQATEFLTGLVLSKEVNAHIYKQDRYGRTIATLLLNGQDINLSMVQAGLAWHYKKYAKEQPAGEAQTYAHAEALAQAHRLALWQEDTPIAPWDWRASRIRNRTRVDRVAMHEASETQAAFSINP